MALVADSSSDEFLQQWIATSAKLYSDVVQVTSMAKQHALKFCLVTPMCRSRSAKAAK